MCEEHLIANAVIQAFIHVKEKFTYSEVTEEIIKRKGILRVSLCVTVADKLRSLEEKGIIKHILETEKYENTYLIEKNLLT